MMWRLSHEAFQIDRLAGVFAVAVCAILKLRKRSLRLPQQHLDPFAVLNAEFSFRVRAGMVGLVSLPAAVIGFRWLTRSKLSPQICARLLQASTEILRPASGS